MAEPPPEQAGDLPPDGWNGIPKAHTNDPTPVSAEGNSLGKNGAISQGESFEEYMKKREWLRQAQRRDILREAFPPPDPQLVKTPPESGQSFLPTASRTSTATQRHDSALKPYGGYDPKNNPTAPAPAWKPYGGYDPDNRPGAPQDSASTPAANAAAGQEQAIDFYEYMRKRNAES